MSIFWRQFRALFWKNWIVLWKHPFLNLLRCFILPVAYGVFLAVAQLFLIKPSNLGIGEPTPVKLLKDNYDGSLALIWADGTNGTASSPTPDEIMGHISSGFNEQQRANIRKVDSPAAIPAACPQNFNLFSECFAAVAFTSIPVDDNATSPIRYTIRADAGLFYINVVQHTSEYELRILPLQWAIDQAIIQLRTGTNPPAPMEWPYTRATNEEQSRDIRLSYIRGLRTLLVLALFVCYAGIAYQLPGAFAGERANLLTAHMKSMGLLDSARIISWHVSYSLVYLPAWVIVGLTWHYRIFSSTHVLLILVLHILFGLLLASYSFFVAAPFGKSPQLAAVASTFLSIVFAILALVLSPRASNGTAFIFSIIFPPGFYIFAIRAICGWENNMLGTNALRGDPDSQLRLLPLLIAAIIDIFLYPYLAVLWERRMYDARNPSAKRSWFRRSSAENTESNSIGPDVAISLRNLRKTFPNRSLFRRKQDDVVAVEDLTLDIPKNGIFVLLGANGAGKSTTLSILAGLLGRTSGRVMYSDPSKESETAISCLPRGTLGVVPQKNVLFPDLTCVQTLRVWRAIKWSNVNSDEKEDLEALLRDCDLGLKINSNANTLSGGQKRKLQLAIGLVGGSKIVFVDECTSGVDPLSRRALWRTLTSFREERTIVFTTHFLDEADLLADHIAILGAPGKLLAQGTPVALKRDLGEGYTVHVSFHPSTDEEKPQDALHLTQTVLLRVKSLAPAVHASYPSPYQVSYHLKSKDPVEVQQVLQLLENEKESLGIVSYDVLGTSIEDIFLQLMGKEQAYADTDDEKPSDVSSTASAEARSPVTPAKMVLASGRSISPLKQALTVFQKRALIARRSWLTPLLAILVAVCGATIPLVFIRGRAASCTKRFARSFPIPLFLPDSPLLPTFPVFESNRSDVLNFPPGIISSLGPRVQNLPLRDLPNNETFMDTVRQTHRNLSVGGVSMDLQSNSALVAWEASSPGLTGLVMLNLASNILYHNAVNSSRPGQTSSLIQATYESFPPIAAGTLFALRWVAFFGAAMAVYPAFFALYVSKERRSSVQAMQFSNGLSNPLALWLGHLLFDWIFSIIASTIIIIVFATATNQFYGLGIFWVVLVLYGLTGTLFAYCASLIVASPLAAFATVAGYQVVMFVLYLAGYLLTLTYAKTSEAGDLITVIHFTMSLLAPVTSVLRASFVSVNLFSLLCTGDEPLTPAVMSTMYRYGGPIVYLIVYGLVLLGILIWVDSGSVLPRKLISAKKAERGDASSSGTPSDVDKEVLATSESNDTLRVLHVSKAFGGNKVVDDVTLGIGPDTIFGLLGPNGAGKTTTFNIIRGEVIPETGDVFIDGSSVIRNPRLARFSLGVCPQFTAIDSQLTVREHLLIYGKLKGLRPGTELNESIEALLTGTRLVLYADRLANKLSGGNQRKLALALALIGNPPVILIDEFSTGIDAKMKREMWKTLRNVAHGKAIIITTHSMEEASALANKVGIIAKRMLAVGTIQSLSDRYSLYEVHFSCRTREETIKAQTLMSKIPNSKRADDVATRFEVPINASDGDGLSLAGLFQKLASHGDFAEYTVEKGTLESVFLKVIRENDVKEEDSSSRRKWWKVWV